MANEHYACVIHETGHLARLVIAVRHENVVDHECLKTRAPHYEEARAEAQTKYPDRVVVVPRLGEMPPPPPAATPDTPVPAPQEEPDLAHLLRAYLDSKETTS